jgi:hypothetical protein
MNTIVAVCALSILAPQSLKSPEVLVDGKAVEFDAGRPRIIRGRMMVPLRGVFEAIGAYVGYDKENRLITAKKNNEILELRMGDKIARKNGAEIMLDSVPTVMNGTTYVPLRFIAEALGAKVEWDKANAQVMIATTG